VATRSVALVPAAGWDKFSRSADVEELAWEVLAGWHYMNPTSTTSIWEGDTGATFYLAFDGSHRIIEAVAGHAGEPDVDLDDMCARLRRDYGIVPEG
jgi:hypothetical protein